MALHATPAATGIVLGVRSLLPLLLAIHVGALMDRTDTRRPLMWLAALGAFLPILYLLFPWIPALLVLQMVTGFINSLLWMGAQTVIGRLVPGDARHYGRFSSAANLGMFVGPALKGATWSMLGPWAGFALISLWGVALLVAVLSIPSRGFIPLNDKDRQSLTPDLRSYVAAGKLLRIPGIMLVILTTFLRIACFSIRGSFYPVYLGQAGFSGSVIGLIVSLGSVIGGMAALLADFFVRLCGSQRNALLIGVALGIISVAITPLMPGVVLLATTACVFGVAMGVNQPILLSMLSSSVSYEYQGMSVGLRTTTNLVAGVSIPILMGFVSELGGISASFSSLGRRCSPQPRW